MNIRQKKRNAVDYPERKYRDKLLLEDIKYTDFDLPHFPRFPYFPHSDYSHSGILRRMRVIPFKPQNFSYHTIDCGIGIHEVKEINGVDILVLKKPSKSIQMELDNATITLSNPVQDKYEYNENLGPRYMDWVD